eukprot:COSAG01_NODE_1786_length_9231_cov_19.575276_2_plen_405_part_00
MGNACCSSEGGGTTNLPLSHVGGRDPQLDLLEAELLSMRSSRLQHRAAEAGVRQAAIDDALDSEQPQPALVRLILDCARRDASTGDGDGDGGGGAASARVLKLKAELAGLRVGALQKKALAAGVSEEAVDDALDEADPKATLAALILATASTASSGGSEEQAAAAAAAGAQRARVLKLKAELAGLRVGALQKKALAAGVSEEAVDDALEEADPKATLAALILATVPTTASGGSEEQAAAAAQRAQITAALRGGLGTLRVGALQRRAVEGGVDASAIDDALETDNPKMTLVDLVVEAELLAAASGSSEAEPSPASRRAELAMMEPEPKAEGEPVVTYAPAPAPAPAPAKTTANALRPHQGTRAAKKATPQAKKAKKTQMCMPGGKHCMLSCKLGSLYHRCLAALA